MARKSSPSSKIVRMYDILAYLCSTAPISEEVATVEALAFRGNICCAVLAPVRDVALSGAWPAMMKNMATKDLHEKK